MVDLCAECYELAGIENAFLDGIENSNPTQAKAYAAEAQELIDNCIKKGGLNSADIWEIPGLN